MKATVIAGARAKGSKVLKATVIWVYRLGLGHALRY